MRLLLLTLCVFSVLVGVQGFTNGTMLPDYICHPANDGLPHSLGGFLTQVLLNGRPITNPLNSFAGAIADGGTSLATAYTLANIHNRNNTVACKTVLQVNTTVTIGGTTFVNQIVPGQLHTLTLIIRGHDFITPMDPTAGQATCDVTLGQVTQGDLDNLALDGAIVYAYDSTNHRVGFFTTTGGMMQYNPGCGPWGMGVVHNQLLSDTGIYVGLEWAAPGYLVVGTTLSFAGAGVSDAGFGAHLTSWPVVAIPTASLVNATVAMPTVTYATWVGSNLLVFFDPETMVGVGASASVTATTYNVIVAATGATPVRTSTNASPASIPWASLNGPIPAGTAVTITVQAQGGTGTVAGQASTSVPYPFTLPTTAPAATVTVTQATSICNATYVYQTNFFSMYQNDNQCAWQALLFASGQVTGAKITGAAASSVALGSMQIFFILAAMLATMLSISQRK